MTKRVLSLFAFFVLIALIISMGTAFGATTGGSGHNRWVELELDGSDYDTTVNITLPEVISENHTFTVEYTHEIEEGYDSGELNNTVTINFDNGTEDEDFTAEFTVGDANENGTVELETDFEVQDEVEVTVTFENDDGETTDTTGLEEHPLTVDILSNVNYTLSVSIPVLLMVLLPVIIIFAIVIPMLTNVFGDL